MRLYEMMDEFDEDFSMDFLCGDFLCDSGVWNIWSGLWSQSVHLHTILKRRKDLMKKADRFKKNIRMIVFLSILAAGYLLLNEKFYFHDHSIFSGDARVEAFRELPEDSVEILFLESFNQFFSRFQLQDER